MFGAEMSLVLASAINVTRKKKNSFKYIVTPLSDFLSFMKFLGPYLHTDTPLPTERLRKINLNEISVQYGERELSAGVNSVTSTSD